MANTNGSRNLDDLMRYLYTEYYKKQQRGFTDEEFQRAAAQIAGRNLDDFFKKYVYGTDEIDYNSFFAPVGLQLTNIVPENRRWVPGSYHVCIGRQTHRDHRPA